jgi:hypothetical protein
MVKKNHRVMVFEKYVYSALQYIRSWKLYVFSLLPTCCLALGITAHQNSHHIMMWTEKAILTTNMIMSDILLLFFCELFRTLYLKCPWIGSMSFRYIWKVIDEIHFIDVVITVYNIQPVLYCSLCHYSFRFPVRYERGHFRHHRKSYISDIW